MTMTDHSETAGPGAARAAVDELVRAGLLDRVVEQAEAGELALTGEGGFNHRTSDPPRQPGTRTPGSTPIPPATTLPV
jgi:hypothetical protein